MTNLEHQVSIAGRLVLQVRPIQAPIAFSIYRHACRYWRRSALRRKDRRRKAILTILVFSTLTSVHHFFLIWWPIFELQTPDSNNLPSNFPPAESCTCSKCIIVSSLQYRMHLEAFTHYAKPTAQTIWKYSRPDFEKANEISGLGTFLTEHAAYHNCHEIIHSCK